MSVTVVLLIRNRILNVVHVQIPINEIAMLDRSYVAVGFPLVGSKFNPYAENCMYWVQWYFSTIIMQCIRFLHIKFTPRKEQKKKYWMFNLVQLGSICFSLGYLFYSYFFPLCSDYLWINFCNIFAFAIFVSAIAKTSSWHFSIHTWKQRITIIHNFQEWQ